jgi:hypothetical protein
MVTDTGGEGTVADKGKRKESGKMTRIEEE